MNPVCAELEDRGVKLKAQSSKLKGRAKGQGSMPFGNSVPMNAGPSGARSTALGNPNGVVSSSPGLRGTSYPGEAPESFSTPTGLRHTATGGPQPRWGYQIWNRLPRVARSSQPLAGGRNPVGILRRNYGKALGLGPAGAALRLGRSRTLPPECGFHAAAASSAAGALGLSAAAVSCGCFCGANAALLDWSLVLPLSFELYPLSFPPFA